MTVAEAITAVRSAGSIEAVAGKLSIRFASSRKPELQSALETLRHNREQALALVEQGSTIKGQCIELWSDAAGGRLFIVADERDAALLNERRGEVLTQHELRLVVRITDPDAAAEVLRWKRTFDGRLSEGVHANG